MSFRFISNNTFVKNLEIKGNVRIFLIVIRVCFRGRCCCWFCERFFDVFGFIRRCVYGEIYGFVFL